MSSQSKSIFGGLLFAAAATAAACIIRNTSRAANMRGKVVLVTGGSRGLGLELARVFGKAGALLVLVARDEEELVRAREILIEGHAVFNPHNIAIIVADISEAQQANRAVEEAMERFGRVDVLINNAGIITVAPFVDSSLETFERVMQTNFFAALHMTQAVVPAMRARRSGAIVNIASIGGKIAVPHMLPYVASKFALVGLSEGLHAELAGDGIRVTTVCPGLMRTGSHVKAEFAGDQHAEFRWFSLGATIPGVSVSARSAARKIFRAVVAGAAEITITPQAWLGARAYGIAPALSASAAGWVSRNALPAATGNQATSPGSFLPQSKTMGIRQWNKHLQSAHNQTTS